MSETPFEAAVTQQAQTVRETIDQLATTGTYVTRDGDGLQRHWNGITHEYVSSEPSEVFE